VVAGWAAGCLLVHLELMDMQPRDLEVLDRFLLDHPDGSLLD
jgi:hypothetical protein